MSRRRLMHSHAVRACMTVLLLAHLSYLSRYAYVGFDIAPDCPVMGASSDSRDCESAQKPVVVHCVIPTEACGDEQESSEAPAAPDCPEKPKKSPKDCQTCQKFALFAKMAYQQLEASSFLGMPAGESVPTDAVTVRVAAPRPFGARAPPAADLSLLA